MDEIHNSDNTLRSRVDGYGFDRSDDQHAEAIDKFMASYLSILARRASRWNNLLSSGERISKNRKLKRFCRKGIPNEHRKTLQIQKMSVIILILNLVVQRNFLKLFPRTRTRNRKGS